MTAVSPHEVFEEFGTRRKQRLLWLLDMVKLKKGNVAPSDPHTLQTLKERNKHCERCSATVTPVTLSTREKAT